MSAVACLLVILLDALLRLALPGWLAPAPPDLALFTAIFLGLRARDTGALYVAIFLGLLQDCVSVWPIGHFAFLYGASAYLASRLRRYVPPDSSISVSVAALFCALVAAFAGLALAVVSSRGSVAGLPNALARAGVGAALAPALFALLDRSRLFRRALGPQRYTFAS